MIIVARKTLPSGLYSRYSPGRARGGSEKSRVPSATPRWVAVTARAWPGAVRHATQMLTLARTVAMTSDCHRKIVSLNGMTPVTFNSAGGMLPAFACSCAADDDRPSAQTEPVPRQQAAPAAR